MRIMHSAPNLILLPINSYRRSFWWKFINFFCDATAIFLHFTTSVLMVWWFSPFSQFPFHMQVPMTCPCSSPSARTLRTSPRSCLSTTTPRPSRTRPASTSPPTRQAARHSTERSSDNTTSRGTSRYIMYNHDFVHACTCTMVVHVSLPPSLYLPIFFLQWCPTAKFNSHQYFWLYS